MINLNFGTVTTLGVVALFSGSQTLDMSIGSAAANRVPQRVEGISWWQASRRSASGGTVVLPDRGLSTSSLLTVVSQSPRRVTMYEDKLLRAAAVRSSKLVAKGRLRVK